MPTSSAIASRSSNPSLIDPCVSAWRRLALSMTSRTSLVEKSCAAVLAKRIAEARDAGHPSENETGSVLGTLDHLRVSQLDRKLVAPERAQPAENPDRATAERRLAESRAALLAAMESGDGMALGEIRHTHLRFGELDLYQWCLFVAEHEKRHVTQLREVAAQLTPAS